MATKSALYEYFWWIPTNEIGDEKPTAFLLCQLSKKDRDKKTHREQSLSMIRMFSSLPDADMIPDRIKQAVENMQGDEGFDADIYEKCVKEIKNIYVGTELKESITDPKEIVLAIAGLTDPNVSRELDTVIWNTSTLTEFECLNFTPTSGCSNVKRIAPDQSKIEK